MQFLCNLGKSAATVCSAFQMINLCTVMHMLQNKPVFTGNVDSVVEKCGKLEISVLQAFFVSWFQGFKLGMHPIRSKQMKI